MLLPLISRWIGAGTFLNRIYARTAVPEMKRASPRSHLAVCDDILYLRSPHLEAPICLLAFETHTLQERGTIHENGSGSLPTDDNRAWGLGEYGPIAACGPYLYHFHTGLSVQLKGGESFLAHTQLLLHLQWAARNLTFHPACLID